MHQNPLTIHVSDNKLNDIGLRTPKLPTGGTDNPSDIHRDREGKAVADLLTHYKNLITLSAMPAGNEATKEIAAAHSFQMEVENNSLVQAAENLLQLTRELKELWLAGPLRGIGEGESEEKMGEDARKVQEMVESILSKASEVRAVEAVSS